jgi:microcystin-dependent protein
MALADWSTTAASNALVLGTNIGEGCPPGNVNDAIRKLMADVATGVNVSLLGTFLSSTTLAQARTALGVSEGSASLNNLAALTNTANKQPYMTGSDGWSLTDMFPSAAILAMATTSVPSGWLECNGAAVSRTTYATLFGLIGTTYGSGDGSTTFNVPELRGEFIRGYDHGRGVDSARVFASAQTDDFKAHAHTVPFSDGGGGGQCIENASGVAISTVTSGSTGGTETRPRNVALMYVIKT